MVELRKAPAMSLPRVRFTLRWLMLLVALVAVVAWGWRLMKLREGYQAAVRENARLATGLMYLKQSMESQIEALSNCEPSQDEIAQVRDRLSLCVRLIDHHARLKIKYERLS